MSKQNERYKKGWEKLKEIDGEAGTNVINSLSEIAPDLADYIIEFAFGDVYSRPGLTAKQRQLVTISSLITQGGCEPQLEVHINASLNVGLTKQVNPMDVLRDFSFFADRYPPLTPDVLGEKTFGAVVDTVHTILDIGQAVATTTDPNEYIELRKAEAYYTTRAFADLATPEVQKQEGFNKFMWRVTGLSITANLGDSLLDARKDHREGKTQLAPSMELYKGLAYDAARHGRRHVPYVLDGEGAKLRVKMIGTRIQNRWEQIRAGNGIPEYSNLRLLAPSRRRK